MSDIKDLEERAEAALAALVESGNEQSAQHESKIVDLEQELEKVGEKLEKEERVHAALQVEFLDVSQQFGEMELTQIKTAESTVSKDDYEELRRARKDDLAEVDEIITKLTPIVEG